MVNRVRLGLLAGSLLMLSACCYLPFDTTLTDPEASWRAAYGEEIPSAITIKRAQYWRSGHWTREEIYFFEFTTDATWLDAMVQHLGLTEETGPDRMRTLQLMLLDTPPTWFAPEGAEYRVYLGLSQALVFDPASSTVYLYAGQL